MTAKQIIDKAKAEIGVCESPANSNNVKYNTWYYGHPVSGAAYPWCCVFVAWLFKAEQSLCKKTASSSDLYRWFKQRGQIVNKPQPGDVVFFKWNKNGNYIADHVGIVVSFDGRTVNTIEGNTSVNDQSNGGMVMQRNRYSNIIGYGRPKYVQGTITNITGHKTNEEIAAEVIAGKWGDKKSTPTRQERLTAAGYNYYEIQKLVTKILKG